LPNNNIRRTEMTLQILGAGCPKCKTLEAKTAEAAARLNLQAEIVKITDFDEIMNMGVMMTPALAIDGEVKSTGKVLTSDQIISIIQEAISK
jgi:small redox-active disulfide protein 2